MTEHSSAYSKLIGFINANGQEREFGGYYAPALDELLDWERDEAEAPSGRQSSIALET